jgi:predicted Zn-dependent peptidase
MIKVEKFVLENGLRVLFHHDPTTPMAVVNTLYDVGAKDEHPDRTGFAHLFEHLMFGGSVNIPDFDMPLQLAGGQSNAFTSNDITNYYDIIPAENLETALWLESDRMLSLAFSEKSLEVQRNVVVEEFKQRYLNQPYGDTWLEFRPLAYEQHPYQWATIGKLLEHIETATMDEVKSFFSKHYSPQNAILCIAGNFQLPEIKKMVQKWYGEIPAGNKYVRNLPQEPEQTAYKEKEIVRDVPNDMFYYGFKMPGKHAKGYYACDLLSDILGRGKSSQLYKLLKKELSLVTAVSAFVLGSHDTGMLILSGQLADGSSFEKVDEAIWKLLAELKSKKIDQLEVQKNINKFKTTKVFSELGVLNKAMALCEHELFGNANGINEELEKYEQLTADELLENAQQVLKRTNCSRLTIKSKSHVE